MVTIDLETLQGWNNLPDGTYSVTVGAKATGYTRIIQSEAVSVVKESPEPPVGDYFLTFSSIDGNSFQVQFYIEDYTSSTHTFGKNWDGVLEYSTDKTTWTEWDGATIISSSNTGKIYFRGINNTYFTDISNLLVGSFMTSGNAQLEIIGNIENLLDYQAVANGQHPVMSDYCFYSLFYGEPIVRVSRDLLPATILSQACYGYMFNSCAYLEHIPALPAPTVTAECYAGMFWGCTYLETLPALPATTLADNCYTEMFNGCASLYVSDTQTAEAQYEWRIPANGVITGTDDYGQSYMFFE